MEFDQLKDVSDEIYNIVASLGGNSKNVKKLATESSVKEESVTETVKAEAEADIENDTSDFLKNDNGDPYLELSPTRRCTIRKWKGNVLIDIREVCCHQYLNPNKLSQHYLLTRRSIMLFFHNLFYKFTVLREK